MDRLVEKKRWRVFYTSARMEKKLEKDLAERQINAFLPKCTEVHQWKDRKKEVVEPLFRNYIFARVGERERLQVLQTTGIVRCISFAGRIAEIPDEEIQQLMIMQKAPHRLALQRQPLPGIRSHVTLLRGPLAGLTGEVLEHRGQKHVIVQVHAIMQAVRVHVPAEWLLEVKPAAVA